MLTKKAEARKNAKEDNTMKSVKDIKKAISKEHGIKMSQIEVYEGWYITDEQEGFDYGINLKHATIGFTCKIDIYGTVTEIKRKTIWDKN